MKKLIRFDWALKKLLRSKANFDILEGFLSELLKKDIRIQKILESESNKQDRTDKYNRVDLLVEDETGELIIIEIQNETELDYLQRILYGTSKVLAEYINVGEPYSKIKKVISISILYFDLGQGEDYIYHGTTRFIGIHKHDELKLDAKQRQIYKKKFVSQVYPEYYLLKINQFNDVARDTLDQWIFFLKNEEIKEEFTAKGLKKAQDAFSVLKLSDEDRQYYNRYLDNLHYRASMYESSYVIGSIEGEKKGEEKKEIAIINRLYEKGIPVEQIVDMIGIPIEKVKRILKS